MNEPKHPDMAVPDSGQPADSVRPRGLLSRYFMVRVSEDMHAKIIALGGSKWFRKAIADVEYGCHCDLEPGMKPDGCVLDYGRPEDCVNAPALVSAGKGREACHEWKPVLFVETKP